MVVVSEEAELKAELARLEDALDSSKWWNWHSERDGGPRISPNKIAGLQKRINRLKARLGLVEPKAVVEEIQGSLF